MAELTPSIVVDEMCRGMLAAPAHAPARAASVPSESEARKGGDHTPRGGVPRRTVHGSDGLDAGTLHTRGGGASGSREAVGDSGSDTD
jgi:hypothetical protein